MSLNQSTIDQLATFILAEYNKGTIVSERHLQAIIYQYLATKLSSTELTLVIEPTIRTQTQGPISGLIPDLLIRTSKEVTALIELKFVPSSYPSYEKDFLTFKSFHQAIEEQSMLYLSCSPKDGEWNTAKVYSISKDLKIFYLVVARHDSHLFTNLSEIVERFFYGLEPYHFHSIFFLINQTLNPNETIIDAKTIYHK